MLTPSCLAPQKACAISLDWFGIRANVAGRPDNGEKAICVSGVRAFAGQLPQRFPDVATWEEHENPYRLVASPPGRWGRLAFDDQLPLFAYRWICEGAWRIALSTQDH